MQRACIWMLLIPDFFKRTRPFGAKIARSCLDIVFPPCCDLCGEEIQGAGGFCPQCFARARPIVAPACEQCAAPLAVAALQNTQGLCVSCQKAPPAWQRTRAAFVYDEWSRQLILPLKYADRAENARLLAREMWRVGQDVVRDAAFLVPVPLHRKKLRRRRYNQAALMARALSQMSGVPTLPLALQRVRSTQPLARLGVLEREREIQGAIAVKSDYFGRLRGHPVVVIDDVLTTGATALACTQALLSAGASRVDLLVAARAGNMEQDQHSEVKMLRDYAGN